MDDFATIVADGSSGVWYGVQDEINWAVVRWEDEDQTSVSERCEQILVYNSVDHTVLYSFIFS